MFKLVVLSALLALVAARPSLLAPTIYSTAIVGHVPTSISHQSSSIVHSASLVAPVLHAAPIVHAAPIIAAPIISAYAAPTLLGHGVLAHHY